MTMRLTESQRDYLSREPLQAGHATKIRLAVKLADANQQALADALHIPYQQLSRYMSGGDLLLSTAWRIAEQFGVSVCDLWPQPPRAKRAVSKARAAAKGKTAKAKTARRAPKAEAA